MRGSKRLFYIVLLALSALIAGQSWAWWSWAKSPVLAADEVSEVSFVQVQIPAGTASNQIGQDLEANGLIRSTTAWKLLSRWKSFRGEEGGFQAGSYIISPGQSLVEIANTIWEGDVIQTSFTVPEGWNRQQMAEMFEADGFTTAEDFLAVTESIPYDRYPWLPEGIPHLEGFLYPDTYQMDAGCRIRSGRRRCTRRIRRRIFSPAGRRHHPRLGSYCGIRFGYSTNKRSAADLRASRDPDRLQHVHECRAHAYTNSQSWCRQSRSFADSCAQ